MERKASRLWAQATNRQRVKSEKVSPCVHKKRFKGRTGFFSAECPPPYDPLILRPTSTITFSVIYFSHLLSHLLFAIILGDIISPIMCIMPLKNRYSFWWRMFFCFPGPRVDLHVGVDTGTCWRRVHSYYSRGPQGPRRQVLGPQRLSRRVVVRQCAEFLNHIFIKIFCNY